MQEDIVQQKSKKEIYKLVGDEYEIHGEYIKAIKKIRTKHTVCGHVYDVSPNNFFKGARCPVCQRAAKKTPKEFVEEMFLLVGDEYSVLEDYQGATKKIRLRHNVCGYEYLKDPISFQRGHRCRKCNVTKRSKTLDDFKNKVSELVGEEYEILEEDILYIKTNKKIKMRHNACGHTYQVTPSNFINGTRCSKCAHLPKITTETYKLKVQLLVEHDYEVIGKYINPKTKISFRHNLCGHVYHSTATWVSARKSLSEMYC